MSGAAAVAGWFSLSALRRAEGLAGAWAAAAVSRLRVSELGDGRDHLPGHTQTADGLVSGDVASHQPEKRCQRYRTSASVGLGEFFGRQTAARPRHTTRCR